MFRIWLDEQVLESVLWMLEGVAELVGPGAGTGGVGGV